MTPWVVMMSTWERSYYSLCGVAGSIDEVLLQKHYGMLLKFYTYIYMICIGFLATVLSLKSSGWVIPTLA